MELQDAMAQRGEWENQAMRMEAVVGMAGQGAIAGQVG